MANNGFEEKGIKRTEDGGVFCEACGASLTGAGATKFIAHMDGTRLYTNVFECVKCGAKLEQTVVRSAADAYWWAE